MDGLLKGPRGVPVVRLDSDSGFRALVELSPDAVFVIARGYHRFANTRGLSLLGATDLAQLRTRPATT
jgi:PAS domain-containing protein